MQTILSEVSPDDYNDWYQISELLKENNKLQTELNKTKKEYINVRDRLNRSTKMTDDILMAIFVLLCICFTLGMYIYVHNCV